MQGAIPLLFFAALTAAVHAQPVSVYSEFARINLETGEVLAPETPREIVSPAVVRNGFTSFQIVIQTPAEDKWWLFVGQNPDQAFKVTAYKESATGLEPIELPYLSEGTKVFWLDVWTAAEAPVRRVKLEPELYLHDDWVIYPMEARVVDAQVPDARVEATGNPASAMRAYLCGSTMTDSMAVESVSIPTLRLRNARQDLALAATAPKENLKAIQGDCAAPASPDPEWYLKIRDYLFRLR
jgi:hypothetical protein